MADQLDRVLEELGTDVDAIVASIMPMVKFRDRGFAEMYLWDQLHQLMHKSFLEGAKMVGEFRSG